MLWGPVIKQQSKIAYFLAGSISIRMTAPCAQVLRWQIPCKSLKQFRWIKYSKEYLIFYYCRVLLHWTRVHSQCPGDGLPQTWNIVKSLAVLSGCEFQACWGRWRKINISSFQFNCQSWVAPKLEVSAQVQCLWCVWGKSLSKLHWADVPLTPKCATLEEKGREMGLHLSTYVQAAILKLAQIKRPLLASVHFLLN